MTPPNVRAPGDSFLTRRLLQWRRHRDYKKASRLYFIGLGDVGDSKNAKKADELEKTGDHLKHAEAAYGEYLNGDLTKIHESLTQCREARQHATLAVGLPPHRRMMEATLFSAISLLLVIGISYVIAHLYVWSQTNSIGFWVDGSGLWVEVGLWATFGACAGGIHSILRHANNFDPNYRFWYLGNLFLAPLLAIPVMFLLTHLGVGVTGDPGTNATANPVTIELFKAPAFVIFGLSFILGFFTRRTYFALINLRDRLLPTTEAEKQADTSQPSTPRTGSEAKEPPK